MELEIWLLLTVVDAACTYVCFQKGKKGLGWVGVIGLFGLAPFLVWFPLAGALGPAMRNSAWELQRAPSPHPTTPQDLGPAPPTWRGAGLDEELTRRAAFAEFLDEAKTKGIITEEAHLQMFRMLQAGPAPVGPAAPTLFEEFTYDTAPAPTSLSEPGPLPVETPQGVTAPPPRPEPGPLAETPLQAPPPPPPPAKPTRLTGLWEAVASDVALHGFSYLGVLLTFVAILGFLFFAFADIPNDAQPFIELGIALIFFAWAWVLRRQEAEHVADGMELVGGMVLPLILFASLVDGAPFPPNFEDGGLIVALSVSALLLAGLYAFYTSRRPESVLRYLVAPLLWLGAVTLGFVFKTDEALVGDAITRLVSPQPALASVAVALTLIACTRWPGHRLALPTVRSALVGVPVAYLLTVSLAVGEDWALTWPMTLLGAATLVSTEVLARWYGKQTWMPVSRPLLLAGVLAPLTPSLDLGWAGVVVAVAYLVLFESTRRLSPEVGPGMLLAAVGVGFGAIMALDDPWSTLIVYTLGTVWAHIRRNTDWDWEGAEPGFTVVAALFPVGIAFGVYQLMDPGPAWLVMAAIITLVALAIRLLGAKDVFWPLWLTAVALVVGWGAWLSWASSPGTEVFGAPTVAAIGVTVALLPRAAYLRLWVVSGLFCLALGMALETADLADADRTLIWAGLGLTLVVVANVVSRAPAAHLAALGHLIGSGPLFFLPFGPARAAVVGGWALGWVASAVGAEVGGDSLTALLTRLVGRSGEKRLTAAAAWFVPLMMVVSLPPAVITAANLWDEFASQPSWTGVTLALIAVGYAVTARLVVSRRPLSLIVGTGAAVTSLVGVALAEHPEGWPMIIASAAVIGIAILLGDELRQTWFVWTAWVISVLLVMLVAERVGLGTDSLHFASLVWGVVMLVGGLATDDILSERRRPGEFLRVGWLRYPVLIGAPVVLVSLALVFTEPPQVYGWWSIAIGLVILLVAYQLGAGSVTGPGLALTALGVTALAWDALAEDPWLFVLMAAPLVAVSWVSARYQSEESAGNPWLRWDLAPLAVAHLIGGFALVLALVNDDLLLTELAFGLLSILVGVWRRGRPWIEVGNVLILLAALEAGMGWPALALAATSVRGAIGVRLTEDADRLSHQLIGVISAGLSWLAVIDWQGYPIDRVVDYSGYLFGGLALAVALATRLWRIRADTVVVWGGLAVAGLLAASAPPFLQDGQGLAGATVTGFGLAVGFAMMAVSLELAWRDVDPMLRLFTPVAVALAWLPLIPALDWDRSTALNVTSMGFGLLMAVVAELTRWREPSGEGPVSGQLVARAWASLAVAGVVIAAPGYEGDPGDGYALTAGGALLSLGLARSAAPLGLAWLRETSLVTGLVTVNILADASRWADVPFAIGLVVLAVAATFFSLWLWRIRPGSPWVRALVVLALVTNTETTVAAVGAWPARALLVTVLLSIAVQTLAVGILRSRPAVLALNPPTVAAAFILAIAESVSGTAQWYTIPIALVLLAEVEILRTVRRSSGGDIKAPDVITLEWVGMGLLAAPGLVEMFTTGLVFGLVAFVLAMAILLWAIVSRVRRRVIAAGSVAVVAAVLLIFAAAAEAAPSSAVFWILAAGVGVSVMLVAGLIEAYRSRRGRTMSRLGALMEGWE